MIKYTYIIPHKDSLELLLRCINSIEDIANSQIIVIDDNSNEQRELKLMFESSSSVELILSDHNIGAGAARNEGLKKAKGKWVLFADADDFFNKGYIEAIDKYYYSQNDIVVYDTNSRFSDTLQLTENRFPNWSNIIAQRNFDKSKWDIPVVWGKLYSREFLKKNSLWFEEVFASNDVLFCYKANLLANNYQIDDFVLYCSTKNQKSLCYSINEKNIKCRLNVLQRTNALLRAIGKNKYQYNIFSLVFLFKRIGCKKFLQEYIKYLKSTPVNNLYWDLIHTVSKCISRLCKFKEKKINQSVSNKAYFN